MERCFPSFRQTRIAINEALFCQYIHVRTDHLASEDKDHSRGRSKNAAFKKLDEDLAKAQRTIRSQSDQTAGVKERRKANIAPQRFGIEGPFS